MKQFLVTFRGFPKNWLAKSEDEWMELGRLRNKWVQKLGDYKSGKLAHKAPTIMKMVKGQMEVSSGSFDENQDTLNGYFVIDAENMDHAVELMRGCPWFLHDRVEIFEADL